MFANIKLFFKIMWEPLFAIVVFVGAMILIVSVYRSTHKVEDTSKVPCESFSSQPVKEIPARCLAYYLTEH